MVYVEMPLLSDFSNGSTHTNNFARYVSNAYRKRAKPTIEVSNMKKIQFDGASKGNPGPMGIGVVLFDDARIVGTISERLANNGTNNIAEYTALLRGIKKARELGWKKFSIEGDSELVIKQVKGIYRVRTQHLKELYNQVKQELAKIDSYDIRWIPRERNAEADRLSKEALESGKRSGGKKELIGTRCSICSSECDFTWKVFKNKTRHIRADCPKCGFIQWAPKEELYVTKADAGSLK